MNWLRHDLCQNDSRGTAIAFHHQRQSFTVRYHISQRETEMKDDILPYPWNEPWIDLGGEG